MGSLHNEEMLRNLKDRFVTNSKFTSTENTPGSRDKKVTPAISEFRYSQRFFVELKELTETYHTEFVLPHQRGAILKLTCKGSFKYGVVHIIYPFDEEGPVIAYRASYFANDENISKDETIQLITKFDTILEKHLPKGLSKECAIDARFLIYFLRTYANVPLEGLPPVSDLAKDVKVVLPVKESKIEMAGRKSVDQKEAIPYDCFHGEHVLYFEDEACTKFLESNEDHWKKDIAPISSSYHSESEIKKMSIENLNPDLELVEKKKKYGGPFRTTLKLEPTLSDIGDGYQFFASLVVLLSKEICDQHGEVYLARCIRACYGLSNFSKLVQKCYGAQPQTLLKLNHLRAACFLARSECIYVDHTDLKFQDLTQATKALDEKENSPERATPNAIQMTIVDDEENPLEGATQDDIQMTIVPITHHLGGLEDGRTLKLKANLKYTLGRPFLVCLSYETYKGHSPALNTFGSYISQALLERDLEPSSEMTMLTKQKVEQIRSDWKSLLDQDKKLPGVAVHVTEAGTTNITTRDFEENGHIKWVEEYNYIEAIAMLLSVWAATGFGWWLETGAFHFLVALFLLDRTEEEVCLVGPLEVILGGKKMGHKQRIEQGAHTASVIILGLVEAVSDVDQLDFLLIPSIIVACVTVSFMILATLYSWTQFRCENEGRTYEDVIARDGSLECVLTPQGGGSFRACDRQGAYGLGLLQAQNYNQAFVHHGSIGTSLASPGASLGYWLACG